MSRIVVLHSISVDGYSEGPDSDLSWHLVDEEVHAHINEQLRPMAGYLNGRVNFEMMSGFWPTVDEEPDCPAPMAEFAEMWRSTPQVVYSRTLPERRPWVHRVERRVKADEVRRLVDELGGDVCVGGASLVDAFRRLDLVDEYWLYIHPVVLGRGRQLFRGEHDALSLQPLETAWFGNGVVYLRYEVRR